jgi:hypothetical protein
MLQQPAAQFDRLRDFPNASFTIRHCEPQVSLADVKARIIEEMKSDPVGFRAPETLEMNVEGGFTPVWCVEATTHCSWYGKYSETRTVTKYRTVQRSRTVTKTGWDGKPYSATEYHNEQEPYNATETVWHPANGAHDFATKFRLPANDQFERHARFLGGHLDPTDAHVGFPPPASKLPVQAAVTSQRKAWDKDDCMAAVKAQAERECAQHTEVLERVAPKLDRADFTLVYLPYASVGYRANGREYQHLFDLTDGRFTGDGIALDHSAVDVESLTAGVRTANASQGEIDRRIAEGKVEIDRKHKELYRPVRRWGWAFLVPGLLLLIALFGPGWVWIPFFAALIPIAFVYHTEKSRASQAAQAMRQQIEARLPKGTPWRDFVAEHRLDLLRLMRITCDRNTTADTSLAKTDAYRDIARRMRSLEEADPAETAKEAECIATALCRTDADLLDGIGTQAGTSTPPVVAPPPVVLAKPPKLIGT